MVVYNSDKAQPYAQWELVDVTFPATANVDFAISHTLTPPSPEHVNYSIVRAAQANRVYHDASALRKVWQPGNIILRSDVASAKVRLLLWVEHSQATLAI